MPAGVFTSAPRRAVFPCARTNQQIELRWFNTSSPIHRVDVGGRSVGTIKPTDHGEATDQDDGPTGTFGSDRDRMHERAHRRTREIYARQRRLVTRHGSTVSEGSSQ